MPGCHWFELGSRGSVYYLYQQAREAGVEGVVRLHRAEVAHETEAVAMECGVPVRQVGDTTPPGA
jgi:hypothetical protein